MEVQIYIGLLFLLGYLLLCAAWVWICLGIRKTGYARIFGIIATQMSITVLVYFLLFRGQILKGIMYGAFPPPFFAFDLFKHVRPFSEFICSIYLVPMILGLAALLLSLLSRPLRLWSGTIAVLVTLVAAVFVGEARSKQLMCASASELGVDEIRRNSFLWSLRNAPREFQNEVHAMTELNGQRLAWSYRDLDWYPLNDITSAWVTASPIRCSDS